jgi:site-specific DNA recombinase
MGRRVLGAARLSHDTDESTSIERQTESIGYACKARGDTLVHVTVDTDVSGAVSPFERDGLGPWLCEPLVSRWDVLMVTKIDRISRSVRDFGDLLEWLKENGKNIVSLDGEVNSDTSSGWLHLQIVITFAEFERRRMSERRKEAADKAKLDGRFDGRKGPFGYMPADPEAGNMRLVQDPVYAPLARDMASRRIDGRTYEWIAARLNEGNVTPRESDGWSSDLVSKILGNPGLNGQVVKWIAGNTPKKSKSRATVLSGPDGMPLKFTDDPVLDDSTWLKLQKVTVKKTVTRRDSDFLLTHVGYCANCGKPLYGSRRENGYEYYRCRSLSSKTMSCGSPLITLADFESEVEDALMARWGNRELYTRKVNPGKDYETQIAIIENQIEALESESWTSPAELRVSARMIAKLETELERLKSLPVTEPGEDWTPAGVTVRDHYQSLDQDGKNHLLEKWGVRALARSDGRKGGGELHVSVFLGDPAGFEQASGVILRHEPEDHIPTYLVNGMLFRRLEDGTMERFREPGKSDALGLIKNWFELQAP